MKRDAIPNQIKIEVALRAGFKCEYCLLPEEITFYSFHIDHIRSIKHGGLTLVDNLAYCCPDCNYFKGSDIGSFASSDEITRFFNPRKDKWEEHFHFSDGMILSKTTIAEVTAAIFRFNELDRLVFRRQLNQQNQYP